MRYRRVQRADRRVIGTSADGLKDDETQHEVESLIVYEHRVKVSHANATKRYLNRRMIKSHHRPTRIPNTFYHAHTCLKHSFLHQKKILHRKVRPAYCAARLFALLLTLLTLLLPVDGILAFFPFLSPFACATLVAACFCLARSIAVRCLLPLRF
jgi:hypothetical protein